MAKLKKKDRKGRRTSLRRFARGDVSSKSPVYGTTAGGRERLTLVYGGGKNYKVTGDFADLDAGATAADNAGYEFIYMNGTLYGTGAGRARASNPTSIGTKALDLTIPDL